MYKQVCILFSLAVAVPVVFSCCVPDRWQGLQGFAVGSVKEGTSHLAEGFYNISFDAIGKKLLLAGSVTVDGKSTNQMILQDYASGNQYVVADGQCTKSALTTPFPPSCIPSDAKKVLSSFFGAGNDKVMIEIYNYMNMGKDTSLTVTKGSCIPMTTYQKSDAEIVDINYFGITRGIMNMTIFDVPKACMHPIQVSSKMHQAVYRRAAVFV